MEKNNEERCCGTCCWFFMIGDEPKDGEIRGRNYCYENDIACEDYE